MFFIKIRILSSVSLADIILTLFMAALITQSGVTLFGAPAVSQSSYAIDAVLRTTSAAVFGYMISSGFRSGGSFSADAVGKDTASGAAAGPKNEIGFVSGSASAPKKSRLSGYAERELCFQLIAVGAIGLASLLLLIFARDSATMEDSAAITQLRSYLSGSVGFLIGRK